MILCIVNFKVKGYKGFDEEIKMDFEKYKEYQFNKNIIKNDIINKAIIYGKKGSGKNNIGFSLFDINFHLTDKNMEPLISSNHLNMDGNHKYAEFYYKFKFENDSVIYKYRKESLYKLLYEIFNNKEIIEYDLELFFKNNRIEYKIDEMTAVNGKKIVVRKKKIITFESIISSFTKALWLYYCWKIYFDKVKFLFMDEFDATYHFELTAKIIERLNNKNSFQSVVTSHNTYLMSNKLTRPDCTFILTKDAIHSLAFCTLKELHEAHNIKKYIEGAYID